MIREVRKVKDKSKGKHIRILINKGVLTGYKKNGFVAYDTFEYSDYKKNTKRGRPRGSKYYIGGLVNE